MNTDLREHLDEEISDRLLFRARAIHDGSCKDYAEYKERCGYFKALEEVLSIIEDWAKKTNHQNVTYSNQER